MLRKKLLLMFVAALMTVLAAFCFVACDGGDAGEKKITVYVGEKVFEVTTEQAYLHGVLKEMRAAGRISAYVYTEGAMISFSQVDVLSQDPTWTIPPFLTLWHNVDEFALKSVYIPDYAAFNPTRSATTVEDGTTFITTAHEGMTLYYSSVGIGALPVRDGAVYAIFVD